MHNGALRDIKVRINPDGCGFVSFCLDPEPTFHLADPGRDSGTVNRSCIIYLLYVFLFYFYINYNNYSRLNCETFFLLIVPKNSNFLIEA